ncbi:MAG: hypothetical protein FD174_1021 [Geobacteraceae bacterium]|nr:MAG: hypothetical protein FD174_1021 [Geobacteraceae bacterium]
MGNSPLSLVARYKQTNTYAWTKKTTTSIILFCRLQYYKLFKSSRTFKFNGKSYRYFQHKYNTTWRTERAVEISLFWDIVKGHEGKKILEVGNVLSHYFPVNHDILDKYEKAPGVLNQDVVDFQPDKRYDLIVSISTLEHVGWDEEPKDPAKILRAIDNLKKCLAPGGTFIVTLPLGQNPEMDRLLEEDKIPFVQQYCLKRISADNVWIEAEWQDIQGAQHNYPFRAANGLVIGIF